MSSIAALGYAHLIGTLIVPLCLSNCRTIEGHLLGYTVCNFGYSRNNKKGVVCSTVKHYAILHSVSFHKKIDLKIVNIDKTKKVKINKMQFDFVRDT